MLFSSVTNLICKSGLSLKKLHKYTPESAKRITILTVFLAGLITILGYNTKTALQKLSETLKIQDPKIVD